MGYLQNRKIWSPKPIEDSYEKIGKAPVSVRRVDTNKGDDHLMGIRCRLVAREFQGADNGRDDLCAETRLQKQRGLS